MFFHHLQDAPYVQKLDGSLVMSLYYVRSEMSEILCVIPGTFPRLRC